MQTKITELFKIKYPIIQGGMIWASGWELVSAVSNAGGLGLLGSGSMTKEILRENIKKCKENTKNSFGVNVPIMYKNSPEAIEVILEEKVPVVFTSAGDPKKYTQILKNEGIKVVQVVSSLKFALKAQDAGVDAIVGEGFEAGGHNGREETTTISLIPLLCKNLQIPVIAAGGIATGSGMFSAMSLGAEGVQIGSRFVASTEAGVHQNFKQMVVDSKEGDTILTLKEISPVRLLKNDFYFKIEELYKQNKATYENLSEVLGSGRPKLGMFEGNLAEGELEIGQVASLIDKIIPVKDIFEEILQEFDKTRQRMSAFSVEI